MTKQRHVGLEHYLLLHRGQMTSGEMLKRIHRHLLEGCETCGAAWDELVDGQRADLGELLAGDRGAIPFDATPPPATPVLEPSLYDVAFAGAARKLTHAAARLARERFQARRELETLLALPADRRERTIARADRRFRSTALAHLLVETGREHARRSWAEALALLDLAHQVILRTPGGDESDQGRALVLRIEAHRANAYRVGGDLREAERRLRTVRDRLAGDPVTDPLLDAEVASLEASLRWDQRRFDEAASLLDQAVTTYRQVGEREGLARVLIQRASIARQLERFDQALEDLERARGLLDAQEQPFLYLFTVAGTAPILLDLERFHEADRVLAHATEAYEAASEPWWTLRLRHLQARAALGLGDLDRAERLLAGERQGCIEQQLPYDAAAASLELALVYLRQGRTAEVRRVAGEIAPIFQGCGAESDALATLALLRDARAVDAAALAHLERLRRHLGAARAAQRHPQRPS